MRLINKRKRLINILILFNLILSPRVVDSSNMAGVDEPANRYSQQSSAPVPGDLTRIYYMDDGNRLAPLPFEQGVTPLNVFSVATDNITAEVKLSGAKAATVLNNSRPSFYVFVADRMDPPPHLLVRLKSKKDARRLVITTMKGRKGYAPLSEDNIRLDYRVLERLRVEAGRGRIIFVNYMEIHPRQQIQPGEYAIIGDSLADIATFRID